MQQESDADPTRVAGIAFTQSAYQGHARVALHGEQDMSSGRACLRLSGSPWGLQGLPVVSMVPGAPAVALLARCTTEFVHRCSPATVYHLLCLPSKPARHMAAGRPFKHVQARPDSKYMFCTYGLELTPSFQSLSTSHAGP